MPFRAAACAPVLAAVLALGAQPSARPAAGAVRWAWSGGVTARSATVKARVSRGGIPVRLTLVRAGGAAGSPQTHKATADPHGLASFDLQALAPATRYGYEVTADGAAPLAGAFRTFGEGPTHSNYATGPGRGNRGFVVMHAAPLDRRTSMKGGPYSHGVSRQRGQFGLVQVTDDGRRLAVELSGHGLTGAPIPGMRLALTCAEGACAAGRPGGDWPDQLFNKTTTVPRAAK
ncbi:MAG TPA: hypothetical protein VLN08_08570 [Vicinamibacterales bacterium]|nr:hypothetical protein [Vicinamibacterales bacterium]